MKTQSAKKYRLQIVTGDRILFDQETTYCIVPSIAGPLGILPGHAPLMGILSIGAVRVRDISGKDFNVFVGRGFFMVSNEGVLVAVEVAEIEDHIDIERARKAMERARQQLRSGDTGADQQEVRDALTRSKTRIMLAEKKPA
jgi:F-type H+-transporting ATPase subunit epsilon